ncbi:hypothetical protein GG851_18190 [Bordetella petrii]|nr:hypothetical protein [Bordetella petrii]
MDTDELAKYGVTTLAIEGGRWCEVKAADVRMLAEICIDDVVAADWMGNLPGWRTPGRPPAIAGSRWRAGASSRPGVST